MYKQPVLSPAISMCISTQWFPALIVTLPKARVSPTLDQSPSTFITVPAGQFSRLLFALIKKVFVSEQRILWSPHIKLLGPVMHKKSLNKSPVIWFECDTTPGFINLVLFIDVIGLLWFCTEVFLDFDQRSV